LALLVMTQALAGSLTGTGRVYTYTLPQGPYSGSQAREFKVYVPRAYDRGEPVPMVMALHGCSMDHEDALANWNWDLAADRHRFIVVFPFITRYDHLRAQNCWGYWFDEHIHEGAGEVADLHRMAEGVEERYAIDPERRYIIGLSSGGGMAVAAAIAYNEYWAAAASVAGLPYGDWDSSVLAERFKPVTDHIEAIRAELDDERVIPFLVVQSRNDEVVRLRSAQLIRDSHLRVFEGDGDAAVELDCTEEGVACLHSRYLGPSDQTVVETVFYDGAVGGTQCGSLGCGHYYGGEDGDPDAWAYGAGPSTTEIAWAFFRNHTLSGNRAPEIGIEVQVHGSQAEVVGQASDPDGTVRAVEVIFELRDGDGFEPHGRFAVEAGFDAFTVSSGDLPGGVYRIHAIATDDAGASSASETRLVAIDHEIHAPVVGDLTANVTGNLVAITGNATDADGDLEAVVVSVGQRVETAGQGEDGFRARFEDVAAGSHTAVAKAVDALGQTGTATVDFAVAYTPPPAATGSIQAHCEAGRIPWAEYAAYYLRYGPDPFTVYQWPDGGWRDRPPRADEEVPDHPVRCVTATLEAHANAGRAYRRPPGWWFWSRPSYYAKGSEERLGQFGTTSVSLVERRPGYWESVHWCD
jgi:poly(hydroxyalkanoate) depolymerase family esterase